MTWKLFVGASIIAVAVLLKAGAPLLPVIGGVALAGWLNRLRLNAMTARTKVSTRR